jgi:GcrA cell cycle regulator
MTGREWTPELIQQLRDLWAEGLPTAEIGRRMGMTKHAVIGKANRLGLAARPSPIKRTGATPVPQKAPKVTLPVLPAASVPRVALPRPPVPAVFRTVAVVPAPAPIVRAAESDAPQTVFKPRASTDCCWPIGHPRTPGFRFCDEASLPGKPYCEVHYAQAYVRVRLREEAA